MRMSMRFHGTAPQNGAVREIINQREVLAFSATIARDPDAGLQLFHRHAPYV
jgi:hypothetical protein